ncbi:MAG: hypothetical protein ACYS0F_17235, partial [Planctomycetota bacterium]
ALRNPENRWAWHNIGVTLRDGLKDADAAIAAFRETVHRYPDFVAAHQALCNLLLRAGQNNQALEPTIAMYERSLELERQLPRILASEQAVPEGDLVPLALACTRQGYLVSAARYYAAAFETSPKLVSASWNAACSLLRAAAGEGRQRTESPAKLRASALTRLRAWLARQQRLVSKSPAAVEGALTLALHDSDLSSVRGEALDRLPAAESKEWRTFWSGVARLQERATSK